MKKILIVVMMCVAIAFSCKKEILKNSDKELETELSVTTINRFTKTNEFDLLQSNFPMNSSDLKIEKAISGNIYSSVNNQSEKTDVKYTIIPVEKENKLVGQIWLYSSEIDKNKFIALYESLENYSTKGGTAAVYFSNGIHLMDIDFTPKNNGLKYSTKNIKYDRLSPKNHILNFQMIAKRSSINSINVNNFFPNEDSLAVKLDTLEVVLPFVEPAVVEAQRESLAHCTARVYSTAKKACESDSMCDTLCDFTPGCHASMLAASAGACIIR